MLLYVVLSLGNYIDYDDDGDECTGVRRKQPRHQRETAPSNVRSTALSARSLIGRRVRLPASQVC